MTMFLAPYTAIADIDGSLLDAGFLFFGEYEKDPELFPVEVFWDADFTVPAAQPIRTRNGYPVRNGSPTKVYLKTAQHSIVIKNRNGAFILVDFKNKGWDASFVVDASGKSQQQLNEITKSLYNFNPDPTATISSQVSVLDYLQKLPLNPSPVHTPKGFANGGVIRIPKGRYLITEPIKLKRGTRICGESHESTQIISRSLAGVFIYEDDGGYVPDEIVAENISIWQDPDYVPTSGAAFQIQEGEYTTAIQFKFNNVLVEGTYKGVEAISGIGCTVSGIIVTKCISHGIDINNKGDSAKSTTSTTLLNCYSFLNGGNGVNIRGSSYISILGGASDSNGGYGYAADTANTLFLNGGAERNALGNAYFKDLSSGNVQLHSVQHDGAGHGIVLNNSSGLNLIGGGLYGSGTNTGNGIHFEANPKIVTAIGLSNSGYTKATLTNNYAYVNFHALTGSLSGGVVKGGSTNNWQFGNTLGLDLTSQLSVVGLTEATTKYGFKSSASFTAVDATYNSSSFTQFISASAVTPTNYNLSVGHYIENAFLGSNTTTTRTAGQYIKEQTRGTTANANLMIDVGLGTVPAGNWSIYNGSARDNYHGGAITWKPKASASPVNNGDLTFELTSNTQIKIKVRGDDGALRSVTLTLA